MRILNSKYFYLLLILFTCLYVIFFTVIFKKDKVTLQSDTISGIVIQEKIQTDKVTLIIKNKEVKIIGTLYLKENMVYENLLGKTIEITYQEKELINNTIPNTFNYKKYLSYQGIEHKLVISDYKIIKNENFFYHLKNSIIKKIDGYSDKSKTYLRLFILGDKTYLEQDDYDNFRTNGIWHLFAVSGMHINLIIAVLSKILRRIKFKNLAIVSFLCFFMFLTSFSPSVMRATFFYIIHLILMFFNIKISSFKELLITVSVIIFINPYIIYNAGFQYSALITGAIMLKSKDLTGNYFTKIIKISLLSIFVSLPITISMNFEINLFSIIFSVFFVPLVSFIIFPFNVLTFFFPFLQWINNFLITILEWGNTFGSMFHLFVIIPKMKIFLIIFYYVNLAMYLGFKKRTVVNNFIILLITIIIPKLDNNYYIYYLDVGQGDSSLIISPHKKEVIMIDTGGNPNSTYHVSDNIILFLKSIGISKIDYLILSHGDFDHMGESFNLIDNFKVKNVIFNNGQQNELEQKLIKILKKKNITFSNNVDELKIKNNKLIFLNTKIYDNENDNSIVIYTELQNTKLLFMGDAGVNVEANIINNFNISNIDILKVGHHGSNTSSSKGFIDAIKPLNSIISVGKNNKYGHPKESVLDTLSNSKIHRTDLDGSVEIILNKNGYKLKTYSP